jgi:adenylate cyclase
MPYLIALGPTAAQKWQYPIPQQGVLRIGRIPGNGFAIPWDPLISRHHADLQWNDGKATVCCLKQAKNPILFHGRFFKHIKVSAGDDFHIGKTRFRIVDGDQDSGIQRLLDDQTDRQGNLTQFALRAPDDRVKLLTKYSNTLWLSSTEKELAANVAGILAEVIPHADSVAIIQADDVDSSVNVRPDVLHHENRDRENELPLNRAMIAAALRRSKTVLHIRSKTLGRSVFDEVTGSGRWSFCTPVKVDQMKDWCIQVAGRFGEGKPLPPYLSADDLNGDVNCVELIAQFIGAMRKVRMLENRFSGIRQFFSPAVIESVANMNNGASLTPTENDTAVLFCDLRGFSKIVEDSKSNLRRLLKRVSSALGVMTRSIIRHDGVISDIQGDSALGFWGWPVALSEGPLPACRAALSIHNMFRRANLVRRGELAGFRAGIGISCGRAIAGKIGSRDQAKVGVFGPVVNLGARLEQLTKQIGVPILIDEPTAKYVREHLPRSQGRCRRIGLIRLPGVKDPIMVSELLPPANQSSISDQNIADFEAAVDAFARGEWDETLELLGRLPVKDRAKDFLLLHIASNNYEAPAGWDGIISVENA